MLKGVEGGRGVPNDEGEQPNGVAGGGGGGQRDREGDIDKADRVKC